MHEVSSFDQRAFRRCLSTFPTGVTVITTRAPNGDKVGVTVNSFASVSLDPPLILWSLGSQAASRTSFENEAHFVVNVLAEDQSDLSNQFARAGTDKWAGVRYGRNAHDCPVLQGAAAHLHCRTVEIKEAGDHLIFIAQVLAIECDEAAEPLICFRGAYRAAAPAYA